MSHRRRRIVMLREIRIMLVRAERIMNIGRQRIVLLRAFRTMDSAHGGIVVLRAVGIVPAGMIRRMDPRGARIVRPGQFRFMIRR